MHIEITIRPVQYRKIAYLALKIVFKFDLRTCNFVQISAWHAQPAQIPLDQI